MIRRTKHGRRRHRRGMGIVPVLAVFAIAVALFAGWTKSCLVQHRDQALREERTQAAWLAEAGVRRGAARLAADPQYQGETWEIAGAEFGRPLPAAVVIRIEPKDAASSEVRIVARAAYPRDKPRVAVSKTVRFTPPSLESPP